MKILYVTPLWTGLKDILFNGFEEARGMPAFIKPLKELISRGHEVDLFLIHNFKKYPKYNLIIDWLKKEQIVGELYWDNILIKKPSNMLKLYINILQILKVREYNFVYGHGGTAEIARKAAAKLNISFGQRLYGTFLYDYIEKNSLFKARIVRYLEYNSFKSPKSFLLVTNDGSKGDKAYNLINKNKKPCDFYFWHNGVDRFENIPNEKLMKEYAKLGNEPFLFHVARIDRWKRQDKAIRILKLLKDKNYNLKLYIAGQIISETYYEELKRLIDEMQLKDHVVFLNAISRDTINIMSKLAIASLSLNDMCNLGNVFHEMLSAGAVIISNNDGSLDEFIKHGENGFLINDLEEACDYIIKVMNDKEYEKRIREKAISTSKEKMKSWEERVGDEIELIERYS